MKYCFVTSEEKQAKKAGDTVTSIAISKERRSILIRIKIDVLKAIIEKYNLTQEEYLYIGDDINDLECLNYAKYRITVPHAVEKVKAVDGIQVTQNDAGNGAFREVADCLVG